MKKKNHFYAIGFALLILMLSFNTVNAQRGGRGGRGSFGGGSNTHFSANYNSYSFRSPVYRNTGFRPNTSYYSRPASYRSIFRLPSNHIRLSYGGNPYYYSNGLFYSSYGLYYNLIRPPFGIRIGYLPSGYWNLNYGGYPYYYYSGVFYQNTQDNQYQVVQPPVGASVPSIPKDAKKIVVNGEPLYDYLGTYYKEVVDQNGKVSYIVQGKDGVLNTDQQPEVTVSNSDRTNSGTTTNYTPSIGDIVLQLPSQYKMVVINDKKMYVTPEHIYYEEFIDNGVLKYKVVGK
jgi:hypothetical protein